jgi:CRP-like cAMP-binding protein
VTCDKVFWLASGWACRERMLPDGRRAILDFYLPGDFIGLDHLFQQHASDSVVTLTESGYYALGCEALLALFRQNSAIALELMRLVTEEKQRLERHATRIARLPAMERSVAALRHLCERLALARGADKLRGDSAGYKLPLSQQILADYLGLNIIHLNRTLKALRVADVLRTESGRIVIGDLQRLVGVLAIDSDLI